MSAKSCDICGSEESTRALEKGGFEILRCNSCCMVYLNYEPGRHWAGRFYSAGYFQGSADGRGYTNYDGCEKFLTVNFNQRIKDLSRYVKKGNVLDVGCGYGFFLRCLGGNYTGFGIDVSEHAVGVARDRYGLDVRVGPLERNTFPAKYFSLITMWDVVEHLRDPKASLQVLHGLLKDNGVVVLTTGNVDSLLARICGKRWHLYTVPEHLWFFSPHTLTNLLHQTGFRVVEMRNEWCYYSVDYIIERLVKTLFNAYSATNRIPFRSLLSTLIVPFTLFDIMYVVFKKQAHEG